MIKDEIIIISDQIKNKEKRSILVDESDILKFMPIYCWREMYDGEWMNKERDDLIFMAYVCTNLKMMIKSVLRKKLLLEHLLVIIEIHI